MLMKGTAPLVGLIVQLCCTGDNQELRQDELAPLGLTRTRTLLDFLGSKERLGEFC